MRTPAGSAMSPTDGRVPRRCCRTCHTHPGSAHVPHGQPLISPCCLSWTRMYVTADVPAGRSLPLAAPYRATSAWSAARPAGVASSAWSSFSLSGSVFFGVIGHASPTGGRHPGHEPWCPKKRGSDLRRNGKGAVAGCRPASGVPSPPHHQRKVHLLAVADLGTQAAILLPFCVCPWLFLLRLTGLPGTSGRQGRRPETGGGRGARLRVHCLRRPPGRV
jgi:hypothetical protein